MADVRLDIPTTDTIPSELERFVNERLGLAGRLQIDCTARAPGEGTIFLYTVVPVVVGFFARFGENAADRLREVCSTLVRRVRSSESTSGDSRPPMEIVLEGPVLIRIVVDEAALTDERALGTLDQLVRGKVTGTAVMRWRPDLGSWQLDPGPG